MKAVIYILSAILILWFAVSFVEVNAKNLNSEPISETNAFYILTEIAPQTP